MNRLIYILKSLLFYRRTHLGVLIGSVFASAVLVGALTVGDSVRYSLRQLTLSRLGAADYVLAAPGRFFQADLGERMQTRSSELAAPILLLNGVAVTAEEDSRINDVQVVGITDAFWQLAPEPMTSLDLGPGQCLVNQTFIDRLESVSKGDTFVLRMRKPGGMPADMTLAAREEDTFSTILNIDGVLGPESFGNFSLKTSQSPPPAIFLPLSWLNSQLDIEGRANALLISDPENRTSVEKLQRRLDEQWRLTDAGLRVKPLEDGMAELQSEQVFISSNVVEAAREGLQNILPVTTYFVNSIASKDRVTPYSFVTAPAAPLLPESLDRGQVLINEWLADDLKVSEGDRIKITYYVLDSGTRLEEEWEHFTVVGIVSMEEAAPRDRSLTPPIPGLTDADNCREWDPGIPIDLDRIRDEDEAYWDEYGPLPKVYLNQADALRMWSSRFGAYTGVRFPEAPGEAEKIEANIRRNLSARDLGFVFQPGKEKGLAASHNAVDFGQLFLGLSFFLIAAAILLTALLFAFNVQLRAAEIGTLRSFGYLPRTVRNLLITEGFVLVSAGAVFGGFLALGYNALILRALHTIWQDAVRTSAFQLHARTSSIITGIIITVAAATASMAIGIRQQVRRTINELQQLNMPDQTAAGSKRRLSLVAGIVCISAATGMALLFPGGRDREAMMFFFIVGTLLLIGLLALFNHALLVLQRLLSQRIMSNISLAVRGTALRRGRSLACIALLALGVFLVITVAANRKGTIADPADPAGGSGGYLLWGKATIPLVHDLNTRRGRTRYGLTDAVDDDVTIAHLRFYESEDASCLNLKRVLAPHLLGVEPELFDQRGAFSFSKLAEEVDPEHPWQILQKNLGPETIPGLADQTDIDWGMDKSVGDTLTYTDEGGEEFQVKIMGGLANSVLQGHVIISEKNFKERFPSLGGYQIIMVDAPREQVKSLQRILTERLADIGMGITTTQRRLAEFNSVENTYLSIFMVLGGLGVLLGSAGMGIIASRNILERRCELAMLRAVGFSRRHVRQLIFFEHMVLAAAGVLAGGFSALVAAIPALLTPESGVPWIGLCLTLAAILAGSMLWILATTHVALRGNLLPALRNE